MHEFARAIPDATLMGTAGTDRFVEDAYFDLVYSNIVLQHMDPRYATAYIREFFRITQKGGFVVFQIPSHLTDEYLPHDSVDAPMPETACRAEVAVLAPVVNIPVGSRRTIEVEVTNLSAHEWKQSRTFQLNLGNHWLAADGQTNLINDDGRSRLPGRLSSGARQTIPLEIKAPPEPGRYCLEIDVVQEGVRWFKDAGSTTARVWIMVDPANPIAGNEAAAPAQAPPSCPEPSPSFTMDGVQKEEILQLIASFGSELLMAEEHVTEWYSYKYYVRR